MTILCFFDNYFCHNFFVENFVRKRGLTSVTLLQNHDRIHCQTKVEQKVSNSSDYYESLVHNLCTPLVDCSYVIVNLA